MLNDVYWKNNISRKTRRYQNLKKKKWKNEQTRVETQYINVEYYSTFGALFVFNIYSYVMWKTLWPISKRIIIIIKKKLNILYSIKYPYYCIIIMCVTRLETKTKSKFVYQWLLYIRRRLIETPVSLGKIFN